MLFYKHCAYMLPSLAHLFSFFPSYNLFADIRLYWHVTNDLNFGSHTRWNASCMVLSLLFSSFLRTGWISPNTSRCRLLKILRMSLSERLSRDRVNSINLRLRISFSKINYFSFCSSIRYFSYSLVSVIEINLFFTLDTKVFIIWYWLFLP